MNELNKRKLQWHPAKSYEHTQVSWDWGVILNKERGRLLLIGGRGSYNFLLAKTQWQKMFSFSCEAQVSWKNGECVREAVAFLLLLRPLYCTNTLALRFIWAW